ncbi:MAG: NAD(P)/FAD-dependent oxidoreductase [Chloroflexi bacterium]|nr:NAD(P)/FAD-dependent oxidoreductase [Chloroflexota bacterium]OJV90187.1 MAG: cyclohexanone monooxygenase [Chloroflexi bacterium 54-19]
MPEVNGSSPSASEFDAVVIGSGFAGLYMLYLLRKNGFKVREFEAGSGVGGTWYWNRYPGARCDSPSVHYSYSFSPELEQEWEWTEKYPRQPEILRYLNHVADRFDLRRDIQLETRVTSATYSETTNRWLIETDKGDRVAAKYCITAVGCLSAPSKPSYKGLDSFKGQLYYTAEWPHQEVDFTGQKVGVIGTGSTGIQLIPQIARQAAHLTVFQRTPNYSLPARNRPLSPDEQAQFKATYPQIRQANRESFGGFTVDPVGKPASVFSLTEEERQQKFEQGWERGGQTMMASFTDLTASLEGNKYAADFVRSKIAEIVKDPEIARMLMPDDHPLGSKRIPIDTEYYETYNRDNISLVDIRKDPIEEFTPGGLKTKEHEYNLDAVVFATGFDALTGALRRINITGKAGLTLQQKWAAGPLTYLGLQSAGFPNLFIITGPGSPSVLTNMPVAIEQHVEWIAGCLTYLREQGIQTIEPDDEAETNWVAHVNEVASHTLYPHANSWYLGANIPGKPRIFMPYVGGLGNYRKLCDEVAANGYEGFKLF